MSNNDDKRIYDAATRDDFGVFVRRVATHINGEREFHDGKYVDAMTHIAQQLIDKSVTRQTFSCPPRYLKTTVFSVALPLWLLATRKGFRGMVLSYSEAAAEDIRALTADIIGAHWFKAVFPDFRISANKDRSDIIGCKGSGQIRFLSIHGSVTSRGADLIIIDDPLNAKDIFSNPKREEVIKVYTHSIKSRLDEKAKGQILVVMQRLHPNDLIGYIQTTDPDFHHLNLPALAKEDCVVRIGSRKNDIWARKAGEALCPQRESAEELEKARASVSAFYWESQYQGQPIMPDGYIIKRDWLKFVNDAPAPDEDGGVYQSWDPNGAGKAGAFSACITGVVHNNNLYITEALEERFDFVGLKKAIYRQAHMHDVKSVIVEHTAMGGPAIEDLRDAGCNFNILAWPVSNEAGKETRLRRETDFIASGRLFFVQEGPGIKELVDALLAAPATSHMDLVDALTQFLHFMRERKHREYKPRSYWLDFKYGPRIIPI